MRITASIITMDRGILIAAVILVGLAMVPALGHASESPGKRRLDRDAYITVQGIYYPGFTLLGISEPAAIITTGIAMLLMKHHTLSFWFTVLAFIGLAGMHLIYWFFTHATNRIWLQNGGLSTGKAGTAFFAAEPARRFGASASASWEALRDRWEYSHIARAALGFLSFVTLTIALAAAPM